MIKYIFFYDRSPGACRFELNSQSLFYVGNLRFKEEEMAAGNAILQPRNDRGNKGDALRLLPSILHCASNSTIITFLTPGISIIATIAMNYVPFYQPPIKAAPLCSKDLSMPKSSDRTI
jgi:hypothetical protein